MASGRRLELSWNNKDMRLLSHGADRYEWVQPTDWRVSEVRLLSEVADLGEEPERNLLIHGDALHALTSLTSMPDLADAYVGKVKLVYIDPPFNTGAPAGLPDRLKDAAPRDLVSADPQPDGRLPSWPEGPFIPLWEFPELRAHLRQVANLARDAERFRKGRNWTRVEVPKRAGLNEQTYGDFEAGRTWPVTATLYRVAEALEADIRLVGRQTRPGGPVPR